MTPQDDDLSQIEADDALLSAIAAGDVEQGETDDAAAALLTEIVAAVDGLSPGDSPGGSGRRGRGRGRHGGLWGISLGVSIVVAAGGGLSAAATDHLPAPVQRFAIEVGQAAPPADAAQLVITPTETPAGGDAGAADGTGGATYDPAEPQQPPWPAAPQSEWWSIASVPQAPQTSRHTWRSAGTTADAGSSASTYDDTAPSSTGSYSWWSPTRSTWPTRTTFPYDSYPQPSSSPEPTPTRTPTPSPTGYTAPNGSVPPTTSSSAPTTTSSPAPSTRHPGGSAQQGATTPQAQHAGSGNPSPASHASPHATTPTHTGHGKSGTRGAH